MLDRRILHTVLEKINLACAVVMLPSMRFHFRTWISPQK